MYESFNFSISSSTLVIICLFEYSQPSGCEVVSHWGFDLYFPYGQWYWTFSHAYWPFFFISSLEECLLLEEVIKKMWHWLTHEMDLGNPRFLMLPHPWNVHSVHGSHGGSHFQGLSLEGMCFWDHVVGIWDWTKLRPLYKLLRFGWTAVKICLSRGCPR